MFYINFFRWKVLKISLKNHRILTFNLQTNRTDVSFAFTQECSTSGFANLPDISTETINSNKESTQFKNKNVSNRKGIFRAMGELKKLQEIINEDKPEPPENQFDL